MGTNYYLAENYCNCCGRYDEMHIGKASAGRKFLFHTYSTLKNVTDWCNFLKKSIYDIKDEYGETIAFKDFIQIIESHKNYEECESLPSYSSYHRITTDGSYEYLDEDFS